MLTYPYPYTGPYSMSLGLFLINHGSEKIAGANAKYPCKDKTPPFNFSYRSFSLSSSSLPPVQTFRRRRFGLVTLLGLGRYLWSCRGFCYHLSLVFFHHEVLIGGSGGSGRMQCILGSGCTGLSTFPRQRWNAATVEHLNRGETVQNEV